MQFVSLDNLPTPPFSISSFICFHLLPLFPPLFAEGGERRCLWWDDASCSQQRAAEHFRYRAGVTPASSRISRQFFRGLLWAHPVRGSVLGTVDATLRSGLSLWRSPWSERVRQPRTHETSDSGVGVRGIKSLIEGNARFQSWKTMVRFWFLVFLQCTRPDGEPG